MSEFHTTASAMDKDAIVAWLKKEISPLTFAAPDATLEQIIDSAVRYWNTHSGYKVVTMVEVPSSGTAVQLNSQIKTVVTVWPSATTTWIWNDHPMWTMMGVTVLDNVTGDMIMMAEAFRNYRIYVGTDFRWAYVKSEDPAVGGKLFAINVPRGTTKLAVTGTKRITASETIKVDYILDWVLRYAKALVYQVEGNVLRKSSIIDVKNDGQVMVDEGTEERDKLQEQLSRDGRWVALAVRA